MNYKLGYIADRTGVPSMAQQKIKLMDSGVDANDIYDNLDDCLASIRIGDVFVVYTTAILGRNKLNQTFVTLSDKLAKGCQSLKTSHLYDCKTNQAGIQELALAWKELDDVTKNQMAAVGRQLGGRKQGDVWKKKDEIEKQRNQGVSWKELSEVYGASEATLRRILK